MKNLSPSGFCSCLQIPLVTEFSAQSVMISLHRDVAFLDTCDNGCEKLAELLGWKVSLSFTLKKKRTNRKSEKWESQEKKNHGLVTRNQKYEQLLDITRTFSYFRALLNDAISLCEPKTVELIVLLKAANSILLSYSCTIKYTQIPNYVNCIIV